MKIQILTYKETIINLFWRALQIAARNGFSYSIFYLSGLMLSETDFGYYNYILKIAFFITLFVDFGISMAAGKFTAEYQTLDNSKIKPMLGNSVTVLLVFSIPMLAMAALFAVFFKSGSYTVLLHLLPLIVFVPLSSLFDAVYRGLKRFKELSVVSCITGTISLFFFYVLIKKYGLTGAFYAQNVFYILLFLGLRIHYGHFPLKRNLIFKTEYFRYAFVIGIIGVFMFLSTQVDVLFLGAFGYFTEVSYYEIILRFLTLLMIPFAVIGHVLSPDFTRQYVSRNFAKVRKMLRISVGFSFISAIVFCAILYFALPPIFELFFQKYNTPELHKMSHIMLVLFFTTLFNGFIPLIAIATGHARWGMYFIVGVGILNVVFDYLSISYWGVWGLIYSTVILKSLANVLFVGYYYLKLPNKPS